MRRASWQTAEKLNQHSSTSPYRRKMHLGYVSDKFLNVSPHRFDCRDEDDAIVHIFAVNPQGANFPRDLR